MVGRLAISTVPIVLVVGFLIGANAGTVSVHKKAGGAFSSICDLTSYKEACEKSLKSVSNTSDPKEFIKAAIESASDAIKSSFELSKSLVGKAKDPKVKMTVEDCRDLFTYATQEIQASYSTVGKHEMATIQERVADIRSWLSAVLSYSETCTEGVKQNEFKSTIHSGVVNATQLTSNALAIVTQLNKILSESFNVKLHAKSNLEVASTRHLGEDLLPEPVSESTEIDDDGIDDDGNPIWVPGNDRHLLAIPNDELRPNTIVAIDGSGQHKSINEALKSVPKNNPNRYIIYVKAGLYKEKVMVEANNVFMYGDGPRRSIVTGDKSFTGGFSTYQSSTFSARGDGFLCRDMGFQNTAGAEGHQAVALHVQSDMAVFYKCRMDGFQDTLYLHAHRQFIRNCVISGTVDFIFGDSAAVIQNCKIIARKGNRGQQNMYTAQKRSDTNEPTGFVIHNCHLVPDINLAAAQADFKTFLGRPWSAYARVVIMESVLGDHIDPEGWMPWGDNRGQDGKVFYAEYANRGPGAGTGGRTKIFQGGVRTINKQDAQKFAVDIFIQGNQWLPSTGFPFLRGLRN